MQKIIPHLWFDKNAEEAVAFYTSVFGNARICSTAHYPDAGREIHGMDAGSVMTVEFEIEGYRMMALNGGPVFTFTPAISMFVQCKDKEEVTMLWEKLSQGGSALMELAAYPFSECYGWLKDKYGMTWQLLACGTTERKVYPSLMYAGAVAGKAEEAIQFYTSIFKDSHIGDLARYGAGQEHDKEGTIMYGEFTLAGQKFAAMDSGYAHEFTFNEAVSLMVMCKDQEEIDYYWEKLAVDPSAGQCGWIKDKYGVSWQITPEGMDEILNDPDKAKANKAMEAMLQMKKIDIEKLMST